MVPTTPMMQAFNQRDPGFIGTQRYFYNVIRTHLILMRRLLALAAAASAAFLPSAAISSTSGTVEGTLVIGYSCDITLPSSSTMTATGTNATATANYDYDQNSNTLYRLSALTLVSPSGSDITGEIKVRDGSGNLLVSNTSEASSASSSPFTGLQAGVGSIVFDLDENTALTFGQGSYSISSTLSCEQSI